MLPKVWAFSVSKKYSKIKSFPSSKTKKRTLFHVTTDKMKHNVWTQYLVRSLDINCICSPKKKKSYSQFATSEQACVITFFSLSRPRWSKYWTVTCLLNSNNSHLVTSGAVWKLIWGHVCLIILEFNYSYSQKIGACSSWPYRLA